MKDENAFWTKMNWGLVIWLALCILILYAIAQYF